MYKLSTKESNTTADERIELFPYSKIFVLALRDSLVFGLICSLILVLTLTLTNFTNWLENLDVTSVVYQLIFGAITDNDKLNVGKTTSSCIFGGPTSCVGPTILIPDQDNINVIYLN